MITLPKSFCWVQAGVESKLHLCSVALRHALTSNRSCLLHRFVKDEWRVLSSQTIGVEFASKIIRVGTGARRKRIKLQVRLPSTPLLDSKLTSTALGYSRHRTLPLRFTLLLSRRRRRDTSLRPHLPPDLRLPLLLPQRRSRSRIPKPHTPPRRQQGRSSR